MFIDSGYLRHLTEYTQDILTQQFTDVPYVDTMVYIGADRLQSITRQVGLTEYAIPETVWRSPKKTIAPSQLFVCQKDVGETRDPRSVLLVAVPGMGKTTMCYRLLRDILHDDLFKSEHGCAIPFLLKFRETNNITEPITLKELLLMYGPQDHDDEDWQSKVWQHLKQHQQDIVLLMDGFDECDTFEEKHKNRLSGYNDAKPFPVPQLLYNLIAGHILSKARVFLTSRPYGIDKLTTGPDASNIVQRYIELEGLHTQKLKCLIRTKLASDFPALCKSFIRYLEQHPSIRSLCFVPRHTISLIDYVKDIHQVDGPLDANKMPQSVAGLLLRVEIKLLETSDKQFKHHVGSGDICDSTILKEKRCTLNKLMDLAYEGVFAKRGIKLLFTNKDLEQFDLTSDELGSGIMSSYKLPIKDTSGTRRILHHGFPHFTLQELKAASKLLKVCLIYATDIRS